ncbi:hypothetical protein ACNKHR_26020 [Shigella flexneri]
MLASGGTGEVLARQNLRAQACGMNFRRLDIEGHRMLVFDHLIFLVHLENRVITTLN